MTLEEVKAKLDSVSPTFCLAKWLQSTTTLYNGMTHSCHHPQQHMIDVSNLTGDPTALHNTPVKIAARRDMLDGVQPPECSYCWKAEKVSAPGIYSDRVMKSFESWAMPYFDDVVESGLGEAIAPSYLEVAFENTCNLSCAYCLPEVSSRVMADAKRYGRLVLPSGRTMYDPSPSTLKRMEPYARDDNPFIDAFWRSWPHLRESLDVFRITGGEPLLSKHVWRLLHDIADGPKLELSMAVNTNLCVPDALVEEFLQMLPRIASKLKQFDVFTSAEAVGPEQEYTRFGMDWSRFSSNCEKLASTVTNVGNANMVFMTTVGILAASTFGDFVSYVVDLKRRFARGIPHKVAVSINPLMHPSSMCLMNLPEELKADVVASWKKDADGLNRFEKMQLERLCSMVLSTPSIPAEVEDLKALVAGLDARRGTDFLEAFGQFGRRLLDA